MSRESEDRFLGGRLVVRQPSTGFRAGLDAVMLAAAVPAVDGETALELGAGVGTAALCLARRVEAVTVTGLEIDSALAEIATANAAANGMAQRVRFWAADALDPPAEFIRPYDRVFVNPPFYGPHGEVSADAGKTRAKMDAGALPAWLIAGCKRTRSGGTFTAILGADRLPEALAVLPAAGVTVFPFWPKAGVPAKRAIVQVRIGSRAPFVFSAGMVLHRDDGRFTAETEAILRDGHGLSLV